MGPSWGHGFRQVTKNEAHQLPAQAAHYRQREAARQGVCADRWRRPSARSASLRNQDLALQVPPERQAREGHDRCLPGLTPSSRRATGTRSCEPSSSEARALPRPSSRRWPTRKAAESRNLTVRVFARRWIDETLFYRSPAYVAQIVRWLDAYIDPAIGDMQLATCSPATCWRSSRRAPSRRDRRAHPRHRAAVYNHAIRNLLVTTNPAQPLRGAIPRARSNTTGT
jgi:hypothetical protein